VIINFYNGTQVKASLFFACALLYAGVALTLVFGHASAW